MTQYTSTLKPKLEKISPNILSSLAVKREVGSYMDYPLHYHPEFEIIYIEKSHGLRVMGNHVEHFSDGDLVFISPNLPHIWKNDNEYYQGTKDLHIDVYVIHFLEDALSSGFFDLPELNHIAKLFEMGKQGVAVLGDDNMKTAALVKAVYHASGFDRLVNFLRLLDALASAKDIKLLSSATYAQSIDKVETDRINVVIDYMMQNYQENIHIDQLADIIGMNKTSFCRYFKSRVHKTCTEFLNEIRISQACKLLINEPMTISEICYAVGYNNISHFNRQFKQITGSSAKVYRNKLLKIA